jgi:hypothetical protein
MYRFVDRDMFMRFRGGGVGHKATRGWDEFLQREGHGHDNAGDDGSESEEDVEEDSELDDDLDTEVNAEAEEHDRSSDEDDEDIVIADDGEELDDDVLAEEGYNLWGTLASTTSQIRCI